MRIVIRIDMDNDAFQPDYAPELSRILHSLAERAASAGKHFNSILDVNGNKCGTVDLLEDV